MTDNDIVFTVIFTTLIILLLIAGIAITIFIANKQRLLQETKMTQMQLDYEKEMRMVQHEVQEQVLVNVGRELHDNIGQQLTVMHLQIESQKLDHPQIAGTLENMSGTLNQTIDQLRMLSKSLNSDMLQENGLLYAIQFEVTRLSQLNSFAVTWEHDNTEPELKKDQKLMAFRMFQEALNNTLKHAQAKNIRIALRGGDKFRLELTDDGKGFDIKQKMLQGNGSGLRNMSRRATLAALTCIMDSTEGKGSIFILENIL